MRGIKLALAGLLAVIAFFQCILYGFLGSMFFWLFYSLFYVAVSVYQRIHASSVHSQVLTLAYVFLALAALIAYAVTNGLPQITRTFYIVFMVVLALALIWEIISLVLVVRETSDSKPRP